MRRDYRREKELQYGYGSMNSTGLTAKQRQNRKDMYSRKRARRMMVKKRRVPPGVDVDHKNGNPRDNSARNLQLMKAGKNRSKK